MRQNRHSLKLKLYNAGEIPPICSSMHEDSPTAAILSVLQERVVMEEVDIHLVDIKQPDSLKRLARQ